MSSSIDGQDELKKLYNAAAAAPHPLSLLFVFFALFMLVSVICARMDLFMWLFSENELRKYFLLGMYSIHFSFFTSTRQ